jgi:uncharacterized protein YukE
MKRLKALYKKNNLKIEDAKSISSLVIKKMTGHASFPTVASNIIQLNTQLIALEKKQAEQKAAFKTYQQKTAEVHEANEALQHLLDQVASQVSIIANSDEALILSTGFNLRKQSSATRLLSAPLHLLAKAATSEGSVTCDWEMVKGAKTYHIEISEDMSNNPTWKIVKSVTKSTCTLHGLTPLTKVWLRVCALNAAGNSAWSDVTSVSVP